MQVIQPQRIQAPWEVSPELWNPKQQPMEIFMEAQKAYGQNQAQQMTNELNLRRLEQLRKEEAANMALAEQMKTSPSGRSVTDMLDAAFSAYANAGLTEEALRTAQISNSIKETKANTESLQAGRKIEAITKAAELDPAYGSELLKSLGIIAPENVLAGLGRQQQISNGVVYHRDRGGNIVIDNPDIKPNAGKAPSTSAIWVLDKVTGKLVYKPKADVVDNPRYEKAPAEESELNAMIRKRLSGAGKEETQKAQTAPNDAKVGDRVMKHGATYEKRSDGKWHKVD